VISPAQFACVWVDEPGENPLGRPGCIRAVGERVPSSPCRCPLTRTAGGGCEIFVLGRQNIWVVWSPALELALSVGRSGWEPWPGRPSPPNLLVTISMVTGTGFVLERLPSFGRTRCGGFRLRQQPSAELSAPSGAGEEVPETPKDLCAFGVDEVCG